MLRTQVFEAELGLLDINIVISRKCSMLHDPDWQRTIRYPLKGLP